MAFLETPIFPASVGAGASRTLNQSVEVVRTVNRRAVRNINNSQTWRQFQFSCPMPGTTYFEDLHKHYLAVNGPGHQFRFQDWEDYLVDQTNGFLGQTTTGLGIPSYQLYKKYLTGALVQWRAIRKPSASGVVIYRNASPVTYGAGAGNCALDTTTGIVTFVADASSGASTHTPGSSHQVTLGGALAGLSIGQKLYLSGVTGTAASILNGVAHTINNIVSSTYTLAISTTGLTASGGTGAKYPQSSDVLAWAGTFEVPVAYEGELQFTNLKPSAFTAQQIVLIEEYV